MMAFDMYRDQNKVKFKKQADFVFQNLGFQFV